MSFRLTHEAEADLVGISSEIGRDNPERAVSYIDELLDRTAQAADNPKLFRLRPEWGAAVRCARHGSYLILFEIDDERVVVLRYLHARRSIAQIMSGEDQ